MKIDDRKRKDIIEEIKALSDSYTPEWKFDDVQPDAASVIGMIFSDQLADNIKKINQVMDKYHVEFANMYGLSLKPAVPARTICTIKAGENIRGGVSLAKGTQVVGMTESGEEVVFAFSHAVNAVNTELTDIIEASAAQKKVTVCNPDDDGFRLFSFQGKELRRQAVCMYFRSFSDICGQTVRIRFNGSPDSQRLSELFADRKHFLLSFCMDIDNDAEKSPIDFVKNTGEFVEIGSQKEVPVIDKDGEKMTGIMLEMLEPVPEDIFLDSVELFSGRGVLCPDFIWNGKNEVQADSEAFSPFTKQPALYDSFLIGQDFVLGQKGITAALDFQLDFGRYRPQKEKAQPQQNLRIIKRNPYENKEQHFYECRIQEVSFEYFNGRGWRRLSADMDLDSLFSKEENAGRYHIVFPVPEDWESIIQGGYEGRCIRMQIIRADNCYMPFVTYIYPILSDLRLCVEEQRHGMAPQSISVFHGKKRKSAAKDAVFTPLPYQGEYVYLGFNRPFGNGLVSLFVELGREASAPDSEERHLAYAYSANSGEGIFKPLKVTDGTNDLQNSGILMFNAPPDMAACEVEGMRRYWLRIEDTDRRFAENRDNLPVVKKIHMNAAAVENIVVKDEQDYYIESVTSGMRFPLYSDNILSAQVWVNERDRLSGDEMDRLMKENLFKTRVEYNSMGEIEDFYILWHEIDGFEKAAYMERCYCIDRSRNELVFGDGASVRIPQNINSTALKVKAVCCDGGCANVRAGTIDRFRSTVTSVEEITNPIDAYGASNPESIQDALKRGNNILASRKRMVTERDFIREALAFSDAVDQAGCVMGQTGITIVLLMKDFKRGDYTFRRIQKTLKQHLLRLCEMTYGKSGIHIRQPVYVKISMDIWLNTADMAMSMEIKQQWIDAITDFLEPVKADKRTGWSIGKLPSIRQIRLMLSTLERTADIVYINVSAEYTENQHTYQMNLDRVRTSPYMVCCSGTHTINIVGD